MKESAPKTKLDRITPERIKLLDEIFRRYYSYMLTAADIKIKSIEQIREDPDITAEDLVSEYLDSLLTSSTQIDLSLSDGEIKSFLKRGLGFQVATYYKQKDTYKRSPKIGTFVNIENENKITNKTLDPLDQTIANEGTSRIDAALEELRIQNPVWARIIEERYLKEKTVAEVAAILNVDRQNIDQKEEKALEKLRSIMDGQKEGLILLSKKIKKKPGDQSVENIDNQIILQALDILRKEDPALATILVERYVKGRSLAQIAKINSEKNRQNVYLKEKAALEKMAVIILQLTKGH